MNWDALGAVGELAGSAAVLVTLVFVALQVRDAKRLFSENASMYRFNAGRETTFKSMELAPAYVKMFQHLQGDAWPLAEQADRFGLDPADYFRLRQLAAYQITNHERNYRSPLRDFERKQLLENAAFAVTADPVGRDLWQTYFKQQLPQDFSRN